MYILGISSFYRNSAACLLKDGEIVAAAQEERFTRKKHENNFPLNAIRWCLDSAGVGLAGLGYIAYSRGPSVEESIKYDLAYEGKVLPAGRDKSYAASAFFASPFSEAAVLVVGGAEETDTISFGYGKENWIKISDSFNYPDSLGLLYSTFTRYLGFRVNAGEYKVMGLAPYGRPRYASLILDNLLDLNIDGSFKLNMEYFVRSGEDIAVNERFAGLFGGPPREPESGITQKDMDIASSVQNVAEEVILGLVRRARKNTGQDHLCLSGEFALNCAANARIVRDGQFKRIWIQPAGGNAACALGAAFSAWYQHLGNTRQADNINDKQKNDLLGPSFTDDQIKSYLDKEGLPYKQLSYAGLPQAAAGLIAQGKVIGWFQGRMEFGPRGLGARSILADPRNKEMQARMNSRVKFREPFRPFAPTVMAERASQLFELDIPDPYMLFTAQVKEDSRSSIPAVTHVDNSSRVQTLERQANPLFYDTIRAFYDITGCPALVNTSFNVRGEPIVCTPQEAFRCFMRSEMDHLIMGAFLLDKRQQRSI